MWLGAQSKVPAAAANEVTVTLPRSARAGLKVTAVYDHADARRRSPRASPSASSSSPAPTCDPIEVPLVATQAVDRLDAFSRVGAAAGYLLWGKTQTLRRGRFITIEGGEGAGKSTQAGLLVDALTRSGITALRTREPGGAPGAEEIRRLLVEGEPGRWDAVSEALLMVAARRSHLERTIWPALDRGDWVVCDRFADSTTGLSRLWRRRAAR